jgi:hypothetical protein
MLSGEVSTVTGVSEQSRVLYSFELEAEVRDWLDSLSDSDFKRVDEVCGMLAEKGARLGGPWSITWKAGVGTSCPASWGGGQGHVLVPARWHDRAADGFPQDPPA